MVAPLRSVPSRASVLCIPPGQVTLTSISRPAITSSPASAMPCTASSGPRAATMRQVRGVDLGARDGRADPEVGRRRSPEHGADDLPVDQEQSLVAALDVGQVGLRDHVAGTAASGGLGQRRGGVVVAEQPDVDARRTRRPA